ncbi:unnamed protein product [Rhizophagus irregularis]|nr:unnamed protein product [Rhizophagus irregularis]CAB4430199.1 unnamed protein product [Rhizophagus irregularis]
MTDRCHPTRTPLLLSLLPPPPAIFNSADELYHNAQTSANSQGYALVKKRTRKDPTEKTLPYVVIEVVFTITLWVSLNKHVKDIKVQY